MGETTGISWADHTFNAWWGCTEVQGSPACGSGAGDFLGECYAKTLDRVRGGSDGPHWGANAPRRFFAPAHFEDLLKWNRKAQRAGTRRRVFIMSMGDWAEGRPDQREHLATLWDTFDKTPWLDKLLLTKRPQLIPRLYPLGRRSDVWMGATAENQYWAELRWDHLRQVDAEVYWLSMEPLFEAVKLPPDFLALGSRAWVVVGGQSGRGCTYMHPDWARSVRDQCVDAGVPFFFKQWGNLVPITTDAGRNRPIFERQQHAAAGAVLDGIAWHQFPGGSCR